MNNPEPPSLGAHLLSGATAKTLAQVKTLCEESAPMATEIYKILAANEGDYEKTKLVSLRREHSYVLELSKSMRAGTASIPGYRLIWTTKFDPKTGRYRECVDMLTGEVADKYTPLVSDKTPVRFNSKLKALSGLLADAGLTHATLAAQSGIPIETIDTLLRGEGKLLASRAGALGVVLKVPHGDVRKAFNISRRYAEFLKHHPYANSKSTALKGIDIASMDINPIEIPEIEEKNKCGNLETKKKVRSINQRTTVVKVNLPDGRQGLFSFRYI